MKKPISPYLFGGSFDPFHVGHLAMMQHLYEQFPQSNAFYFVPTGKAGHKPPPRYSRTLRKAMLQTIIEGECRQFERWQVGMIDFELNQPEAVFTYQTLIFFNQPVTWVMGDDQFFQFHTWKCPHTVLSFANLLVFARGSQERHAACLYWQTHFPDHLFESTVQWVSWQKSPISSTIIRDLLDHKQPITHLVPKSIEATLMGASSPINGLQ